MPTAFPLARLTAAAALIAVGVIIPVFSPLKIVVEPASFTLASHVSIFIAMFISPAVAVAVALGTTAGFFLGGFPIVIVLRAASHLVFAFCGAYVLQKRPQLLSSPTKTLIFSFAVGLLHAVCEVAVVSALYFGGGMGGAYYAKGFAFSVLGLVGLGTVAHSMLDFAIALGVVKVLGRSSPDWAK